MSAGCEVGLEALLDYALGETAVEAVDAFEDHLFACGRCARRLEEIDRLRRAVAGEVLRGTVSGSLDAAFLDRARRDGLTLREYRIAEGATVACSAGPEDLVVVRLAAVGLSEAADLTVDATFDDLERGTSTPFPPREVLADRGLGEVVLVFPGEQVRAYPRCRWTLRLHGESADAGPYVMDHTP